jgi:hypothetical protein
LSASPAVRCGSSAFYSCPALELAYLCACLLGVCVCLTLFLWGKGKFSDQSAGCHCQHAVMDCCLFLNAAEPSDCGCPGSEPCSLPPSVLPYFRQWPSSHLFTDGSCKLGSLLPPLLPCTFSNPCHLRCALVFSSIAYSAFFWVGGSVCPGGLCWFILGVAEGHCVTLGTHLFGLLKVSQAHLEPVAASSGMGVAARLFSQCFMAWRRCSWARGSECQSFNSPWCFTSTKYGSSISARYLIHRSHAVCICVPVAILDPPHVISYVVI